MTRALAIAVVLVAACKRRPDPCVLDGGHWVRRDCHEEWTIDLQPQADGTISDFSHYDTVCATRCER